MGLLYGGAHFWHLLKSKSYAALPNLTAHEIDQLQANRPEIAQISELRIQDGRFRDDTHAP